MNKQRIIVRELKVFIDMKWQRNKISELQIEEQKCSQQKGKEKKKKTNKKKNKSQYVQKLRHGTKIEYC